MAHTILEAMNAIQRGDRASATKMLCLIIEAQPMNEAAWLLLALAQEDMANRRRCLTRVLEINPDNKEAAQELARLELRRSTALESMSARKPTQSVHSIQCPKCGAPVEAAAEGGVSRCKHCNSSLRFSRDDSGHPVAVLDEIKSDTRQMVAALDSIKSSTSLIAEAALRADGGVEAPGWEICHIELGKVKRKGLFGGEEYRFEARVSGRQGETIIAQSCTFGQHPDSWKDKALRMVEDLTAALVQNGWELVHTGERIWWWRRKFRRRTD